MDQRALLLHHRRNGSAGSTLLCARRISFTKRRAHESSHTLVEGARGTSSTLTPCKTWGARISRACIPFLLFTLFFLHQELLFTLFFLHQELLLLVRSPLPFGRPNSSTAVHAKTQNNKVILRHPSEMEERRMHLVKRVRGTAGTQDMSDHAHPCVPCVCRSWFRSLLFASVRPRQTDA